MLVPPSVSSEVSVHTGTRRRQRQGTSSTVLQPNMTGAVSKPSTTRAGPRPRSSRPHRASSSAIPGALSDQPSRSIPRSRRVGSVVAAGLAQSAAPRPAPSPPVLSRSACSLACSANGPPCSARLWCTRAASCSTSATASAASATWFQSASLCARACLARGSGSGLSGSGSTTTQRYPSNRGPRALLPVGRSDPHTRARGEERFSAEAMVAG